MHLIEDGIAEVATGSPDIGGSRASMALMAAETLGVDYFQIRSIVADTASIGFTGVTGGSRVTFVTGMAPGFSTQFCGVEVDPETGKR